ncbi:hypothetical protein PIROE2DRAFT_57210 [Piromyces sp. E2]|nr:hypothetical protein PIROE2DRAFT_57210 [Piromyces sp. E2]|eukprot:OUM69791.1 hypothetical protein PIROE2DRAFT_57210 [Piromyces sp. E2]
MEQPPDKSKVIELINKLEVDEHGIIKYKNFAKEIFIKRSELTKLPLRDSYLPKTEWYCINISENGININDEDESDYEVVIVRISDLTQPLKLFKELIQNEYKLNVELQLLDYGITTKFKGYSFFKTKVVSIFFTHHHYTLANHVKKVNLKEIVLELVNKLNLIHPQNKKCYLTPTLSPNNILWSQNELYTIIFTEIFLSVDSENTLINIERIPSSKWFVPEFSQLNGSNQCTLSFYSSVHSFGCILYYLITGLEPPESEEEWRNYFNDNSNNNKMKNKNINLFRDIIKDCINASETNPKDNDNNNGNNNENNNENNNNENNDNNNDEDNDNNNDEDNESAKKKNQKGKKENQNNGNNKKNSNGNKEKFIVPVDKFIDGYTYKGINDNTKTIIYFVHIDIKLKSPINFDIEVYDLYKPTTKGYKLLKYEFNNKDGTKYFSVVPFYIHNNMKELVYGVRPQFSSNNKVNLIKPKLLKINNDDGYKIILTNVKPDKNLKVYEPIYENALSYLKHISLINPKNYEYSYQYLLELTDSLSNNDLVDMVLKTGFNTFTEEILNILSSRSYLLKDISNYIESNYKITSSEYTNAPKLILKLIKNTEKTNRENHDNNKEDKIVIGVKKSELLCDSEFLFSCDDKTNDDKNIISDTIDKLDSENFNSLKHINKDYCEEKIKEYNNSVEGQKKKLNVILTPETINKIKLISVGILSNIPIIIQGFTSAGKSFISTVSSVIHRMQYPISTALSENTTVEDLLGRFVLQRKNSSMMTFVPGLLLTAYTEGRILILDECDLAKPEVLSCILGSITKDEINVNNTIYKKMKGYNVILTMNGEAEGFTKNQRNELNSTILSKFVIIKFDEISKKECENIFKELIPKSDNYNKYITNFVNLHDKMLHYKQHTVDPLVTLRNLKACTYLSKINVPVRFSAEIAYTGRFPIHERNTFKDILDEFGNDNIDNSIKEGISKRFNEANLYYNDSYLKCAYLALAACKAGLHPLLIGKNGSGLTELAKFVAYNYTCSTDTFLMETQRKQVELIQLGIETSVDDLLGCFQPNTDESIKDNKNSGEGVDLTKIISWVDGPIIRAGKKGNPVILDRIDGAKAQVIECLNPLLEDNSVFNNVQFKLIEKDNKEQIDIGKGFVIISTMSIEDGQEMMSKALMNRFVPIYLDDFLLNSETIKKITEITIKNVCHKINYNDSDDDYELNEQYSQNNSSDEEGNDDKEEDEENGEGIHFSDFSDEESENDYSSSESQNDSDDGDDNDTDNDSYDYDNDSDEDDDIPIWYNIVNFSDEKINDISNFIKDLEFNNLKSLVKTISKLCYIIQRTNMNVFDSYALLNLDKSIYDSDKINDLISKMLNEDNSSSNKFFFNNDTKGNAMKMILSLISCDLSNSPVFIQGSPGSGKSVAARHYGAFRTFNNRDPILSISCNSDMLFEQFVGTFSFKNTSFQFVEGPLLTAMKNGEPILIDEFNLCSEEVLVNLLPLLKAEVNDYIKLKGVPYKVQIKPGFLFIATGNDDNEPGRKKMPQSILNELAMVKISNPSLDEYKSLLGEIINNEYQECKEYITPDNICDIVKLMEDVAQQSFSLRQIKSLLKRIKRFCTGELIDIESNEEYKKIPVSYIIIGFIIPGLKIGPERVEKMVKSIGNIFDMDSHELLNFIKSDVSLVSRGKKKVYLKKGKIILSTSLKRGEYPPSMLQTYFWIRMSCSLYSDSPSQESLLLEGPTSYKSYLLEMWLKSSSGKDSFVEHFVTKNTETQDLIGLSTLDDKEKLRHLIDSLIEKSLNYLSKKKEYIEGNREDKLEIIKNELKIDKKGKIKRKSNVGLEYIYRCSLELIKLEENYGKLKGIKTMTSFNLGFLSSSCIFGQKLVVKEIDQVSPSVLERINSVLEYPRSLVLTEDTQGIFNNQQIFKNLYESNRRSVPISDNFSIYFTSREIFNGGLSEAFKSRCTIINCPSYDNKLYLGIKLDTFENYSCIAKSIITEDDDLQKELIELYDRIHRKKRIPVLSFIRWCNTTKNINKHLENTNAKYVVGISVLRSVFDGYEPNTRNKVIKELLFDYLPKNLYNLLERQSKEIICDDTPLIIEKRKDISYIKSRYSNIQLHVFNPNIDKLKEIRWTKSAIDMADSILTALAAHTMLILEGPPGRGKTAIAMAVYEALGIDYKRINLSPSTTDEDIFVRTVPIVDKDENIKTENLKGPLYQVLNDSSTSIEHCRNGLILDEINLASNELLDQLTTFLISLFYKGEYHTPQGEVFKIGNIGVIATMNDAKLSNARTTLSSTILNLSHTFRLPNYEPEEMKILAESILGIEKLFKKKENLIRAINCFFNSLKYTKYKSETGGVTLREILKLKEFSNKCPDVPLDTLLDLVLCANMSEEDINQYKNENQFNNTLSNITPEIKNNKLCFKDLIKYDLLKDRYDGPVNKQFTLPERDALMKILIGLTAKRTILLSGDTGTGKTHIIESLADIIGVKLNVIQFNTETSSSDTIGRLEMSVDPNEVSKIKYELNKLMNILINDEWPKITSFIKFINEETLNSESMNEYFDKLIKEYPLSQEASEQLNICCRKLKHFSTLSCTSFEFQKSLLINAMEKGEWVLLDDVNYAPQEIERLMSLLEENCSLTIYEQNPPVIYSREFKEDTDFIKHKQIHENFRLFVITSNESVLSAAIKSRCLCVKLQPFAEPQHYAELISSCLNDSYIPDSSIITTAKHVGKAFYDIKEHEKENDYILRNYKLTTINLVNLSKILINNTYIDGNVLSEGINFNIFSMFKSKDEQFKRFKTSLSSDEIDFNITTMNKIMKDKKYMLGMIERKILEYAMILSKKKNKIDLINEQLNKVFTKLYNQKRMAKIMKINNENKNIIINYVKNSKVELMKNLESFTVVDMEEYKEYIDEVLCILEELIPKNEEIYCNLYYLKQFNVLLEELTSIKNTKIKGLKLETIENSKEYFLQFYDDDDDDDEDNAENDAKKVYWFRNAIKGFDFLIPEKIPLIDLRLSIISIYYNYYNEEYNQLESTNKKNISKNNFIYLKMLENIELRKVLKRYNFTKLNKNIRNIFEILVYYDKPLFTVIGESANKELTIEMNEKIIIRFGDNEYSIDNSDDIDNLKTTLGLGNIKNKNGKKIDKNNYADDYIDYIFPKCLKNKNDFIGGYIFWFYKLFAQTYLGKEIINNDMLCEFNDAIEYILKLNIFNVKNTEGIWNSELEEILNKGYQLIYSLKNLKNVLWKNLDNENKRVIINKFIEDSMDIKNICKLYVACNSKIEIIEYLINTIDKIKNYYKKYGINLWEKMDLFINTCTTFISDEKLKEKFKKEKIEYAKQLDIIKNKINDICDSKNKYKFISLNEDINKLKEGLNEKDNEEIEENIKMIEKRVNMFKIANDNNINESDDLTLKKTQILSSINNKSNDYKNEYSKILYKYSKLCDIVNKMKTINKQQNFINYMFRFCDISSLESFIEIYKYSLINECLNDEFVSTNLIIELKHLVNSLFISDVINIINTHPTKYINYLDFIKDLLKNDLDHIKSIGKYFGDDEYIYLPKVDIIDLKYCVRYGMDKKTCSSLIKIPMDVDKSIRESEENEKIEDYWLYLISRCDKNIDCSTGDVEKTIKYINEKNYPKKLKETVNNLYKAFKLINSFRNMKYKYNCEWLIKDIDGMKNEYWKEPGKIVAKNKFNSLLQFNNETDIFNKNKIIAKSLYATYEANIYSKINSDSKYLNYLLNEILNDIYSGSNNYYKYGYRLVLFYDKYIYKDNVAETMVSLINSIFKILEESTNHILNLQNYQIKDIITSIIHNFIIDCIEKEFPDFDNTELINITNILITVMLTSYESKYKEQKNELENIIRNEIESFIDIMTEIEGKITNTLNTKYEQYITELDEYNDKMNDLKERYINENPIKKFIKWVKIDKTLPNEKKTIIKLLNIFNIKKNKNENIENYDKMDIDSDNDIESEYDMMREIIDNFDEKNIPKEIIDNFNENNIPEEIIRKYKRYNEENIKEENLKKYSDCKIEKPVNYKYDEKLNTFTNICERLKEIQNLPISECIINIIKNNDIENYMKCIDVKYKNSYNNYKNKLINSINNYLDLIKNNSDLSNKLKGFDFKNSNIQYNIEEDVKNLNKWINELLKCNINMGICEYSGVNYREIKIENISDGYSANTNWIFDKDNKPNFLLDNINVNLGIYILEHIHTNNVGSISFDNNCSYPIAYELEQDKSNSILAYSTENKLQQSESMTIKFRLNKKLKYNETIKCEFFIKLINNDNDTYNKCRVIVYLNVIPLCLKFKINEKYHIDENNKISINHYVESFEIEHQYPGNYSSKNLGAIIKSNEKNKYNKLNINQQIGKIILNLEKPPQKLWCSNRVNFTLNKSNLLNLNLDFVTPTDHGLIIYDEKNKNIKSIDIVKGYKKSLYLFNMSISPITIKYKYTETNIKLLKEIKNINPGEKKKLEVQIINNTRSNELLINDRKIIINTAELPKLCKTYYWWVESISCYHSNARNINEIKFIIINNQYKYQLKSCLNYSNTYTEIERLEKISSCYLIYKNKIIDKIINNYESTTCQYFNKVFGFIQGNFYSNKKYDDTDIVLKLNSDYNHRHIFTENQMNEFSNNLKDNELINNLQSDDLKDIFKSIEKLIHIDFEINVSIDENIENLVITGKKTSISNIIKYLIKMSKDNETNEFINQLKSYIKIMYNREILLPYFKVNDNLDEDIKQFLKKFSYIISFVDIVVNPGILSKHIIDYINNNSDDNEVSDKTDQYLFESFKKCFSNGFEKDNEDSELVYYNNKIYKHTEDDDFEKFSKQIKESFVDNNNYDKEKINNFIITYKEKIDDTMKLIIQNKIKISNLYYVLDECIKIVTKIPLILSTIDDNKNLSFCVSNCQKIYDFILNLIRSPVYKTEFSEKIYATYNEIKNILSKYNFFDLKTNENTNSKKINSKNNSIIKSIVQCELPVDNSFENDLVKNDKKQEINNQFANINNKRNICFNNSQYVSTNSKNYNGEYLNNSNNINRDNREILKQNNKPKQKIEFVSVLTPEERASISIPFLNDNIEQSGEDNSSIINNPVNDMLDYENMTKEMKISTDILEKKLNKTTPKEFLEMVLEKTAYKDQTLSDIKPSKLKRKGLDINESFNYYDDCSQASSFIQSTISNIIKSNIKFIDNNKILPNSILDSYVDIAVDITHMSEVQRIAALVISTGISIPLSYYGVNIRISVFGERNGVWLLSDGFSKNVDIQLARLRDALASKKRYMSFPGDALYSLKCDWKNRFDNEQTNYTSVLISSLISPQVVNKQNDWSNDISNNIVVFGLKSEFDEEFKNKLKIYDELLQIPTLNKNLLTQEFLEPINVIGQNESERNLLEKLCKSLVMSCIYKSSDKDNFKEYEVVVNNMNNNTVNEKISMENIFKYINNNMEDKIFFGQNIPHIMTNISKINESFNPPKILLPSTNDLLHDISSNDNSTIGSLISTVESILKSQYGLAFAPNSSAAKVPSASGGTISIPAIKKWIVSGFTYKEIFMKKAGKTQRKYSITIAIDLSSSIHLSCNYSHAIATILLLLLAPSTLQDNEEIKIDVIISTLNGPKIMFMSSKANTFESFSRINSIINVINKETPNFCTPGNTLNAAYQLQLQKGGVGMGKNIFFITDSYVTSKKEILFANSLINSCENAGIDLMTIGVGSYPNGIKELYPKCCYTPSLRVLGDAIAFLFAISRDPTSKKIIPQVIIDSTTDEIQSNLSKMITEPPDNKELQRSIENKKTNYIEMMGNNDTMILDGNMSLLNKNPEIEPYSEGLFKGFNILVVILYLGGYEYQGKIRDQNITVQQFESGAGKALKRKGFNYKLVFSYGEAINELTKSDCSRCPYIETWIFCSRGDGSLPSIAMDKDSNKIIPFLKCITEFNNNGGGLLLFSDNEPFTLETNILLSEYLNFEDENGIKVKPKFRMKGNYNEPDFRKKYIVSMNPNNKNEKKHGKFKKDIKLSPPGKCYDRLSLRPGLVIFSEGITLSYAECSNRIEDYSPFTPFAYLTDKSKERPFILYYDPKMKEGKINQGPIVVHGGFTSGFYDFSFEGTGRLVTSIACWLVRYEERIYKQFHDDMKTKMIKDIPAIFLPNYNGEQFTKWKKMSGYSTLYSIMVLDVSGSMEGYYQSLINMANTIINNQLKNPNNKGTVILFGNTAKAVVNGNYRTLTTNDIKIANVGGGTDFYNAFHEATKYIRPSGNYDDKRLLFLTDGKCNLSGLSLLCDQISSEGFSIHILGFGNELTFSKLKPFVRRNGTFQAHKNFNDIITSAVNIFAAE